MGKQIRQHNKTGEEAILDLIGSVYDASMDTARWPEFLSRLSDMQGGAAVGMVSFNDTEKSGRLSYTVRSDPVWQQSYAEYFATKDVFVAGLNGILDEGVVWPGHRIISNSALSKSEFYTDWMAPQDLFHTVHCVAMRDGENVVTLGAGRKKSAGQFDQTEMKVWEAVVPHLRRAIQIQKLNSDMSSARNNMGSGLSHRAVGVILVASDGNVIETNDFAEQLLAKDDGLTVVSRKLVAGNKGENERLARMFSSALEMALTQTRSGGNLLNVSRPSGQEPYKLLIAPAVEGNPFLDNKTRAVAVYISDPETELELDADELQISFGFTDAETRIAILIVKGLDVARVALQLSVSTNTVRTHLKRIFDKTGTRRQSQLVLKILSSKP